MSSQIANIFVAEGHAEVIAVAACRSVLATAPAGVPVFAVSAAGKARLSRRYQLRIVAK